MFGVFAAVLTIAAGMFLFSAFMFYDDEGYVLLSLRNFAAHGHLYDEVYSQYGPFPYAFYSVLHWLGFPFTHTAGRLLTLTVWGGAALASAQIVWRDTRSYAARYAVLASVFVYLWVMTSEPTHPGGLIAFVTAMMAYAGHRAIAAQQTARWATLVGVGIAVLSLTKINIGGFAALAAASWWLLHHENPRRRRVGPIAVAAGVVLLPLVLMRPVLSAEWVQTYAILFACAGLAATGAVALGRTPRTSGREIGVGALWATGVVLLVLGLILARGTSLHGLLEGMLLRPLRLSVSFNLNFPWPHGARAGAAISLTLFVMAWLGRRHGLAHVDDAIAVSRLLALVGFGSIVWRFPASSPDNVVLAFGLPWLWLFLWPLAGEDPLKVAARSWVGLLLLGQYLHAFPVRGSQIAWGTFLAIPVTALGAWQAARWLEARHPSLWPRRTGVILQVAVFAFAIRTGWTWVQAGNRYYEGRNLNLPGAESIRLPTDATALFRLLTLNAKAHGDMLFSLPGMFSLNLWSDLPTPTLTNVTHWFSLLEPREQEAMMRSLETHPRACVVVQREHVGFLTQRGFAPRGPLIDYLHAQFEPAFQVRDFEFWVRKERKIAPLLLGEILTRPRREGASPVGDAESALLQFTVLLPRATPIARAEISTIDGLRAPMVLDRSSARVELTPVNLRGEAIAPRRGSAWPVATDGPTAISLFFDAKGFYFPPQEIVVVLRDPLGAEIGLVLLKP